MAELLFWNTLSESAGWLSKALGEQVTPKSLIQKILDRPQRSGIALPTIVKALIPKGTEFAKAILMPNDEDAAKYSPLHSMMTPMHGELGVKGALYSSTALPIDSISLYPADLAELIKRNSVEITGVNLGQLGQMYSETEVGALLPLNTKLRVTLDDCGINRDDLMGLFKQFSVEAKRNKTRDPRESLVQVDKSAFRKLCPANDYENYGGFRVQDDGLHLIDALEAAIDKGEVEGDSKEILNDHSGHALKFPCSLTQLRAFVESAGLAGCIDEGVAAELVANLQEVSLSSASDAGQAAAESLQTGSKTKTKEKKKLPWQILCEEQRNDVYLARIASGKAAPKTWVAQELAGRCKKKGYVTANGLEVDAGYIERHLLREWEPPELS